jgi:hypothetical protein
MLAVEQHLDLRVGIQKVEFGKSNADRRKKAGRLACRQEVRRFRFSQRIQFPVAKERTARNPTEMMP